MKRLFIVSLAIMMCFCLTFTGCSENELTKVKVNEVAHSVFYAPQYAAISLGYFEEEGLEIDLTCGNGADKVLSAVLSGDADIGFCGPEATIYVYQAGEEDYPVSFAQLTKRDGSFLIGRQKNDDFKVSDLKGSYILGGRKGGVPEMTLEYILKMNGLTPGKDVTVDTSVQFAAMSGAFIGGKGDYVSLFEPNGLNLEKEGEGYVVMSLGKESGEVTYTLYNAKKSYIEENPEIIKGFTNAIAKGLKWVNSATNEEIADAIKDFFPDMKTDDLVEIVKRYKDQDSWNQTPLVSQEGFERLQDIMILAGELEERVDYNALIDTSFTK